MESKKHKRNGVHVLELEGALDQTFDPFCLVSPPGSTLVVDVSGVHRVTSTGVRQWLKARDEVTAAATYIVGARTSFVTQANLVADFLGDFQVVSVHLPYYCEACDEEFESHLDLRIQSRESGIPTRKCPGCGGVSEYDDDPTTFTSNPAFNSLTPDAETVAPVLDSMMRYQWDDTLCQIDVQETFVAMWLAGILKGSTRYRRYFRDIDDNTVVLLGGVGRVEAGAWKKLLKAIEKTKEAFAFARVPAEILDKASETIGLSIVSALLPFRCATCLEDRLLDVDEEQLKAIDAGSVLSTTERGDETAPVACTENEHVWTPAFDMSRRSDWLSLPWTPMTEDIAKYLKTTEGLLRVPVTVRVGVAAFRQGEVINGFRLQRKLGAGGMGDVYLAREESGLDRDVAIKVISPALLMRAEYRKSFLNEARLAAQFSHPNIVQVYQLGEFKGIRFLVMEYVEGWDLSKICTKMNGLPMIRERSALWIMHETLFGLHALHSRNGKGKPILHRDISPQNILVSRSGAVKLSDFGVAVSAETERTSTQSRGKQAYWAPETIAHGVTSIQTDIYAAAVTFYELVTARRFLGNRDQSLEEAMSVLSPTLDVSVGNILRRGLAPDPANRYADADEMRADVALALGTFSSNDAQEDLAHWLRQLFGESVGESVEHVG